MDAEDLCYKSMSCWYATSNSTLGLSKWMALAYKDAGILNCYCSLENAYRSFLVHKEFDTINAWVAGIFISMIVLMIYSRLNQARVDGSSSSR